MTIIVEEVDTYLYVLLFTFHIPIYKLYYLAI